MGRRAAIERPVDVHVRLPAPLVAEMNLLLWSEAHGRVPYGQLQTFIDLAVREKLQRIKERIDESYGYGKRGPVEAEGSSG